MVESAGSGSRSPGGLLVNRNFVVLWCAYGISAMGDHLSELAVLRECDALDAGVDITRLGARFTMLLFVPFFLFAPITGLLADRLPRRMLMIAADVIRCLILLNFALLMHWTWNLSSWGPLLPVLLIGTFSAVFSPARAALLPTIIRPAQLVRANGMISGLGIIATMLATMIGGYLADHHETIVAFRLDAFTFLVSAVFLAFMVPPKKRPEGPRSNMTGPLGDVLDGFRYARCHKRVLELVAIGSLLWFCGAMVVSVMPGVVKEVYQGQFTEISTYRALFGLGFIIGAVIISTLGNALRSEIAITWGLFGASFSIAVFGLSVFLPLPKSSLAFIGAVGVTGAGTFGVAVVASFNALLQRIVPDRYRGRIFGFRDICTTAALLLATGLLGVPEWTRMDRWVGHILIAVAMITFAAGFITLTVRMRRSGQRGAWTFARNATELIALSWWRLKRIGPCRVPREGAVIIAANHTCAADPLLITATIRYRPVAFMVAAEYTTIPIVRSFLRLVDCIPVKRTGQDTAATKQALRHLREGKALGIFIEGRIVPPGEKGEPKDGVALLALKTGASVIPVHISGTTYHESIVHGLLHRHRARVRFGEPVDLSEFAGRGRERDVVSVASGKIYGAIKALGGDAEEPG